jgi:hypothetical protein
MRSRNCVKGASSTFGVTGHCSQRQEIWLAVPSDAARRAIGSEKTPAYCDDDLRPDELVGNSAVRPFRNAMVRFSVS